MSDYSGRQLRQYRLRRVIDKGGFADVYEALEVNTGRHTSIS